MSADFLREAATTLRTLAGAVDGWYTAEAWATTAPFNLPIDKADAAYIATMNPGVGLLLADLFDRAADDHDETPCPAIDAALAVARAVLGRES